MASRFVDLSLLLVIAALKQPDEGAKGKVVISGNEVRFGTRGKLDKLVEDTFGVRAAVYVVTCK